MIRSPVAWAILGLAAFAAPTYAQSLEVSGDSPLSIETLTVKATVEEGFALVDVDQTFRNGTDRIREGVYRFRLPESAVVHTFSMWMEGKEKQGRVLEAEAARRIYDSIVHRRKDPALLEQIGWRSFRVSVFPIPARDTVRIRLRYAYALPDDLGLQTLEIPLPEHAGIVGRCHVTVNVAGSSALSVLDCPSHPGASIQREEGAHTVTWASANKLLAPRFVVRSMTVGDGLDVAVLAHKPASGDGFFVARVLPKLEAPPDLPRDVVFVVDRSGSMQGRKMKQAVAALQHGLGTLGESDRFDVITFSKDATSLGEGRLLDANEANVLRAREAAREIDASGGTNIHDALQAAVRLRTDAEGRLFMVVFLTDGMPTVGVRKPARILEEFRRNTDGRVRLFAFGVGENVKDFLLSKLAREGRGHAVYVRGEESLEVPLSALFSKVRTPLLTDPQVTIEGVDTYSIEPRRLPDVYRDSSVVLVGRYRDGGRAVIRLKGMQGSRTVTARITVKLPSRTHLRPHVPQLWARLRVDRLLDDLRVDGFSEELRAEIVRLGVTHQVVSPYTSFLVVEDGIHIPDAAETARVPGPPDNSGPSTASRPGSGAQAPGPGGGPNRDPMAHGFGRRISVPPHSREPGDPSPTPSGGGASTPGAGAGGVGAPATGGHGRGGSTPYTSHRPGYEDWTVWWQFNHDGLLESLVDPVEPLRSETISTQVLPELRAVLADEFEHPAVVRSALTGLARAGDRRPDTIRRMQALARNLPPRRARDIVEGAPVALALTGDRSPETRNLLTVLAPGGSVRAPLQPGYAAVALGLTADGTDGDAVIVRVLTRIVARPVSTVPHHGCAALTGLGLSRSPRALDPLLLMLEPRGSFRRLSGLERAYAIDALGRLAAAGVAPGRITQFLRGLVPARPQRMDNNLLRSVVLALGNSWTHTGPDETARVVAVLREVVRRTTTDRTAVAFALASLARIARDGPSTQVSEATRKAAYAVIEGALRRSRPTGRARIVRPHAAIALGSASRGGPDARWQTTTRLLESSLDATANEHGQAAYVLALGLTGRGAGDARLRALVTDEGADPRVRGSALVALALTGTVSTRDRIAVQAARTHWTDQSLIDAAVAAGDSSLAGSLVAVIADGRSSTRAMASAARGLGRIGTDDAARELVALLSGKSGRANVRTRVAATIALGRMAGRGRSDRLLEFSRGLNYRAFTPYAHSLAWGD